MKMPREELSGHHHHGREQGPQEETLQGDGHGGGIELRDQPQDQPECYGQDDVCLGVSVQSHSVGTPHSTSIIPKWKSSPRLEASQTPEPPVPP